MTRVEAIKLAHKANTKHGLSLHSEYQIWNGIRGRCLNPNVKAFKDYGGRGIEICARWRDSPQCFIDDMGQRPSSRHEIERKDNNGPYSPENCIWTTSKTNCNNRRGNIVVSYQGKTQTVGQWADELGVCHSLLNLRLKRYRMPVPLALYPKTINRSTRDRIERELRASGAFDGEFGWSYRDSPRRAPRRLRWGRAR